MQIILFHKHAILSLLISLNVRDVTQLVTKICPIFLHIFKAAKKTETVHRFAFRMYAYAIRIRI